MSAELKQVLVAVFSALLVGLASSYLTATTTLARYEVEHSALVKRVERLENASERTERGVVEATGELRVLSERMKALEKSVERIEKKLETDR